MASYAWFMLAVLLFVVALAYAFIIPPMNDVTDQMNKQISAGDISEQTAFTYGWNLTFLLWLPAIGLIGAAIWAVSRAIEVAEAGSGGGGSYQ